jgi:hypothetical protein
MSPTALSPPPLHRPCRSRARRCGSAVCCASAAPPSKGPLGASKKTHRAWEAREAGSSGTQPPEAVGDVARLGMWDTPSLEGPSCVAIRGAVETESLAVVEQLYLQARSSYFAGHPHVADDMFDRLEVRVSPSARLCGVSSSCTRCSALRHTTPHACLRTGYDSPGPK